MKATIVPIGNSKGIRIPKTLLEQCHIGKEVVLEVQDQNIIIKPVQTEPRKGWEQAFKKMRARKEDKFLIDDRIDTIDWEW